MSYNKAILIGNLGRDPEIRTTQTGKQVAALNLATSEKYKDRDGNYADKTEWHRLVAWGNLAQICERHLKKGSRILVEGKIETRKWTSSQGEDRYTTEIIVRELKMLGDSGGNRDQQGQGQGQPSRDHQAPMPGDYGSADDLNDDIPF